MLLSHLYNENIQDNSHKCVTINIFCHKVKSVPHFNLMSVIGQKINLPLYVATHIFFSKITKGIGCLLLSLPRPLSLSLFCPFVMFHRFISPPNFPDIFLGFSKRASMPHSLPKLVHISVPMCIIPRPVINWMYGYLRHGQEINKSDMGSKSCGKFSVDLGSIDCGQRLNHIFYAGFSIAQIYQCSVFVSFFLFSFFFFCFFLFLLV